MNIRQDLYRAKVVKGDYYVTGIHYKHLPNTSSPLGDPVVKESDYQHYLIGPEFSDWELRRGFRVDEIDITTIEPFDRGGGVTK